MGFMSNTVSMFQYQVLGDLPPNHEEWAQECLMKNAFKPIDATADEESVGWVSMEDQLDFTFDNINTFSRGDYLVFTLRRDRRTVPAALLKNMVAQECQRWLRAHSHLKGVPSQKRVEIRENLTASLMTKALPIPSAVDIIWNTATGILNVASLNTKVLDLLEDEFRETFTGLTLMPIHPMKRAEMVCDDTLAQALMKADQAATKDVLLQIKKNRWLGWDFFLWLLHQTEASNAALTVTQPGPFELSETFFAYLNDGFLLTHEQETVTRKSHITGPQDEFNEARMALKSGKSIIEGIIHFEKGELSWRMNLKGYLFAFGSFTCPAVRVDKDIEDDKDLAREAAFFERMALIEEGAQLFNSLLHAFLVERLDAAIWEQKTKTIRKWLEPS